jgi:hypothetical protein
LVRRAALTVSRHDDTTAPAGMSEMLNAMTVRYTFVEPFVTPT